MHPILAHRDRFLLYMAAWFLLAAIVVLWLSAGEGFAWTDAAAFAVPPAFLLAFICLSALYICRAFPLQERTAPLVALVGFAASALTGILWALGVRLWAGSVAEESATGGLPEVVAGVFPALAAAGALVYLLSLAGHYLLITFDHARAVEREALESAVTAREAELKALKAQIQPHFLFNSLHSISALTARDPAAARDMAVRLADFMRTIIAVAEKPSVPLRQELSLAENYLAIEKVRFGDRLRAEVDVPEELRALQVLPLTLQPLVENAVKHGIGGLTEGGTVTVRARRRGGLLEITVTNPFDPDRERAHGTGSGLDIVRRRLAAAYGREGALAASTAAGVHAATITMPART